MNDKLLVIAKGLGYCCVHKMLQERVELTTGEIALELSVTSRAVRQRRKDIRDGKLKECERCESD